MYNFNKGVIINNYNSSIFYVSGSFIAEYVCTTHNDNHHLQNY